MIAQIVVFPRKTAAQMKKILRFVSQKLRKSFANGNPSSDVEENLPYLQPRLGDLHNWTFIRLIYLTIYTKELRSTLRRATRHLVRGGGLGGKII